MYVQLLLIYLFYKVNLCIYKCKYTDNGKVLHIYVTSQTNARAVLRFVVAEVSVDPAPVLRVAAGVYRLGVGRHGRYVQLVHFAQKILKYFW